MAALIPSGKGVYLRDDLARKRPGEKPGGRALDWCKAAGMRWAAINVAHERTCEVLAANGIECWAFALPDDYRPGRWPAALDRSRAMVRHHGARGILADPEMGWASSSPYERASLASALRAELAAGTGVGVTTHDGLRAFGQRMAVRYGLAQAGAWASPQVYDHQRGETLERPRVVAETWAVHGWAAVCPSVGTWGKLGLTALRDYLAALPRTWPAAALWYAGSAPKGTALRLVAGWQVGVP